MVAAAPYLPVRLYSLLDRCTSIIVTSKPIKKEIRRIVHQLENEQKQKKCPLLVPTNPTLSQGSIGARSCFKNLILSWKKCLERIDFLQTQPKHDVRSSHGIRSLHSFRFCHFQPSRSQKGHNKSQN